MRFTSALKFGALAAAITAAWTLLAWKLGWHEQDFTHAQHSKKVAAVAFTLGIWLAVRERRSAQGGWLQFGEGFETGVAVCVVAAFLTGAFEAFYGQALNPGWLQRAWEWKKAGMIAAGAKELEIARHEASATASQHLFFQLVLYPIGRVMFGLILAAAVAAILRHQPAAEETSPPNDNEGGR